MMERAGASDVDSRQFYLACESTGTECAHAIAGADRKASLQVAFALCWLWPLPIALNRSLVKKYPPVLICA